MRQIAKPESDINIKPKADSQVVLQAAGRSAFVFLSMLTCLMKTLELSQYFTFTAIPGIAGTGLMSLYLWVASNYLHQQLNAGRILGSLITFSVKPGGNVPSTPKVLITGNLAHYAVGIGFMTVYQSFWQNSILKPDVSSWLLLGCISGLIAVLCWNTILRIHPKPPRLNKVVYFSQIFFAHFIFVAGCIVTYLQASNLIKTGFTFRPLLTVLSTLLR